MTPRTVAAGPLAVKIQLSDGKLRSVSLPKCVPEGLETDHLASIIDQLGRIPVDITWASPFRQQVWHCLQTIPWGTALTYGEVADKMGNPSAVRAVGQACGANEMPLIIPCHRVLANDSPGGFALGLEWKLTLLELEAAG